MSLKSNDNYKLRKATGNNKQNDSNNNNGNKNTQSSNSSKYAIEGT